MAKDIVCGADIDENTCKYKISYMGKMYYFCSRRCMETFRNNPIKYAPAYG